MFQVSGGDIFDFINTKLGGKKGKLMIMIMIIIIKILILLLYVHDVTRANMFFF